MKIRLHSVTVSIVVSAFLVFIIPINSFSQHFMFQTGSVNWEAGINIGPSGFLGDLGGNTGKGTHFVKDLNLQLTNIMKGVFITAYPTDWFGVRLAAESGKLEGDDAIISTNGADELWRKQRDLDFRTNITEGYIAIELFPFMILNSFQESQPRIRPYVVGGVGVFHFNPQGSVKDANGNKTWYYLHPLRTEGQGMKEYPNVKEYSLTQLNLPLGCGLKYFASDRVTMSLEFLYRKTFTDYIDDVSHNYIDPNLFDRYLSASDALIARRVSDKTIGIITPGITRYAPGTERGNPKSNDAYFNVFLKFGVRLGESYGSKSERSAAHQIRCPKIW